MTRCRRKLTARNTAPRWSDLSVPALRRELAALTPGKRAAGVRRVLTVRRFLLWRAGIESRRQQRLAERAGTCPS